MKTSIKIAVLAAILTACASCAERQRPTELEKNMWDTASLYLRELYRDKGKVKLTEITVIDTAWMKPTIYDDPTMQKMNDQALELLKVENFKQLKDGQFQKLIEEETKLLNKINSYAEDNKKMKGYVLSLDFTLDKEPRTARCVIDNEGKKLSQFLLPTADGSYDTFNDSAMDHFLDELVRMVESGEQH